VKDETFLLLLKATSTLMQR